MRSILSVSVVLLLVPSFLLSRIFVEARGVNATLDHCSEDSDCRYGLVCFKILPRGVALCLGSSVPNNPCRCLLPVPITCDAANYICPPGEGCGRHKISGNTYCVSCSTIADPNSNYSPIKGVPVCKSTPTPLPTPSPSPGPPRRKLDLCSDVDVCESPLVCTGHDGTLCEALNQPCYCLRNRKAQGTCTGAVDCENPNETCLKFVPDNSTTCGSCTRLNTDPMYIPAEDGDTTCADAAMRNVPDYVSETSGLSFDFCQRNSECVKPRVCAASPGIACKKNSFTMCQCQGVGYKPFLCNDTSDCLSGEVCMTIRGVPPASCLSLSKYYQSPHMYHVKGEIAPRGNLVAHDDCTSDEQCVEGLYCTHLSESTLGGCRNRRGCTCIPPAQVQCSSSDDCRRGESCARIADAQKKPQCLSTSVLLKSPYFKDVSQTIEPTPTILPTNGWLTDACRQDSDCKQDDVKRVCRHYTESTGSCGGRNMCICALEDEGESECESSNDCGAGERCVVLVDSKKSTDAICISAKILQLEIFVSLYVEVCGNRRGAAVTPSSSPSMSAISLAAKTTPTTTPTTIPASPSSSYSSVRENRRACYAKCKRRYTYSQ